MIKHLACSTQNVRWSDCMYNPTHSEPIVVTENECLPVATVIEWTPLCEDDAIKPSTGRVFGTLAKAKEFYTCYARLAGFIVRKGTSLLEKNRELVGKYFLCSKQGLKENRKIPTSHSLTDNEKKKEQGVIFEKCARLYLV